MAQTETIKLVLEAQNNMSGELKKATNQLSKVKTTWKDVAKGIIGAQVFQQLGRSIANFAKDSVAAFRASELAEAKLLAGMQNVADLTGQRTQLVKADVEALKEQAKALQQVTKFSDDAIINAQAMLSTFALQKDEIMSLTPRVLDMAASVEKLTGGQIDLQDISLAVGKSMTMGAGALGRYGIVMSDAQRKAFNLAEGQEKIGVLTEIMDQNFKGFAEGAAKTFDGQMKQLSNDMEDFQQEVGRLLAIFITHWLPTIKKAINVLKDFSAALGIAKKATNSYGEELKQLDKLLRDGRISEEAYAEELERIVKQAEDAAKATENRAKKQGELIRKIKEAADEEKRIMESRESILKEFSAVYKKALESQTDDTFDELEKRYKAYKEAGSDLIELEKWKNIELDRLRKEDAKDFVAGVKGGYDAIGAITGHFAEEIGTGLSEAFTGIGAPLEAVGLSVGGIFGSLAGTVLTGFMNMFGQQKSFAQSVEESFDKLVGNTNRALGKIGEKETFAKMKLDILDKLQIGEGGKIAGSEVANILGVTGLTKQDAQLKLLRELLETQQLQTGFLDKSEKEIRFLAENRDAARFITGGSDALWEAANQFLTRDPIERLGVLGEMVDTQNAIAEILGDVPQYAEGGIVTKPTLAMIGEAGAEAVIPLNKAGGTNINVTFQTLLVDQMTTQKAAKIIDKEINKLRKNDQSLLYARNTR